MSTPDTTSKTLRARKPFVFPDPPEDPEDKMTSFDHLAANGNAHYLAVHLGNPDSTLNQSQGGMCICRTLGIGLGGSQEGLAP